MREYKELLISRFEDIKANYRLYMWPRGWCDNAKLFGMSGVEGLNPFGCPIILSYI